MMFQRAKSFFERYERRLSALAFFLGFIWDNLTLTRVDRLFDNLVLVSYLLIAFVSIALINAYGTGRFQGTLMKRGSDIARFLLPFAFGGLFSGFLIFYSRSGEVFASAPFLLLLIVLFFGNELFRKHYQRFVFQMSIFFVTLFSYMALLIPILSGRIGWFIFILSGVTALLLFVVAIRLIALVAREEVDKSRHTLFAVVGIVFITFNFLYFNNMIPPIPLSLKEIGIYHEVSRTRAGAYHLSFEKAPWYALGKKTSAVFMRTYDEPVYAFTSVFAPTRLDTEILHRWSYLDPSSGEWVSSTVVSFPISGGRNEGYRGYSIKEHVFPGKWRVDVETLRGDIIGRFVFTVKEATLAPILREVTL
ncbi:MAG: hypothetical protein A2849_03230 [Candidatus Taylorbacteria bacterium RIFCSPHIGHO2_01_FULL_51_15]|uniref:DUF2914 domain-containing protein n=1 Tax=Candidatus Taylorbacteria bacterium RIFCSPHIGHO2_01_FULL_51_15 TaxID=1802304 RepID=A0A1G2ME51_9BACT|nr:MAG: hypothetical protein A2849_03230 [Candidatus Taylorbacteria bacterium RIFCSPHIGHO2_01_FULL_51_15]